MKNDAPLLYEVERRAEHAARPGLRITELQISNTQKVPSHYHRPPPSWCCRASANTTSFHW